MTDSLVDRVAFENARLSLARQVLLAEGEVDRAYAHAARVSATALQMTRVGIWRFEDHDERLVCACLYTAATQEISRGDILHASAFPKYLGALRERRAIVVPDAQTDPITSELVVPYLSVFGITSMLDAPVILDGRVIGVVCHEHVGPPRLFEQREIDFASSVADMVALIEMQAVRLRLEMELRARDELVQRSAKFEALGRLARSAAHDFNNVLGVVMIASELLLSHRDAAVVEHSESILEAAKMGARISRELLVVGRQDPAEPRRLRLDDLVVALAQTLRVRFGERLEIVTRINRPNCDVLADPSQIERVLLNLGVNAGQAIKERGTITIHLREPSSTEAGEAGCVALEVSDTGTGMSSEVLTHLFEPYFTTKADGHGLGLASVYGIVRQLNGRVLVQSEVGSGSTFVVILPTVA